MRHTVPRTARMKTSTSKAGLFASQELRGYSDCVGTVTLIAGHVQPLWAGHPWVFAQAVQKVEGGALAGDEVDVLDPQGNFLGRGLYSPHSALAVRVFSRVPGERLDASLITHRIQAAVERRQLFGLPSEDTDGYRLIHAEGDGLPGLVVDRFGADLVLQVGCLGMKLKQSLIVDALRHVFQPRSILDRTSARVAEQEGFRRDEGPLVGSAPDALGFRERAFRYRIPGAFGQKTGFYFDQRPLRARIEALAKDRRVLDAHTYVGAMAMAAARGGASEVHAVDSSAAAIEVGAECAAINGLSAKISFERGDALTVLQREARRGGYDLVICDPPKLAASRAHQRKSLSTMRRLAAGAARATRPGGLLVLCSCSAAIDMDTMVRILALACRDVGLQATVLERGHQGPDHPVLAAFPEGLYLSCIVAQIRPVAARK